MPLSKNPFFHSQTRRKSESAAIPTRDHNVKRNTAMSPTTRSSFAPPVPPKDDPPKIASAAPMRGEAKKTLAALERDWMLNDCLASTPTPPSEGGSAQEYIPDSMSAEYRNGSLECFHDSVGDASGVFHSGNGPLQCAPSGVKTKGTKRDTVVMLMNDIMGSHKEVPRRHQDLLEAAATLGALPLPLRIANKPETSLHGSIVSPGSKFNKLEPGPRLSLRITTSFNDPRTAPIPLVHRRSDSQDVIHMHSCKDAGSRPPIMKWVRTFSNDLRKAHSHSKVPSEFRQNRLNDETVIQTRGEKAQQPLIKQARGNTFPDHESFSELRQAQDTFSSSAPLQRRNIQPIMVNRMRDPDETFHEMLAIHRRATADFDATTATATKPGPDDGRVGSFTRGGCTGFYATAKSHADDIMEHVRIVGRKEKESRQREKMKGEIRRKYEEMVSANASARRADEV